MRTADRLDARTAGRLAGSMAPAWRAGPDDVRVAHLGPGAFHRSHQAMVIDLACQASGESWGIGACASRGTGDVDLLAGQDRLFSVLAKGADTTISVHGVIGSVGDRTSFATLLAAPTTTVATLTVTEPHYPVAGPDRRLDLDDESVRQDLADAGHRGRSLPGLLHRGLLARWHAHGEPVSVLSCDNIVGNGRLVRGLVTGFAEIAGAPPGYRTWLDEAVAFPDTVVDRLTPRPCAQSRAEAQQLLGLVDAAAIVTEEFWMWVIEDALAAPHPPWQTVGARLVPDVRPYEQMKLMVLNGAHTLLAATGLLLGAGTVREAMTHADLACLVAAFHDREAVPSASAGGVDAEAFADQVRRRFANPGLEHRLADIAAQSSSKVPQRLVPIAVALAGRGDPGRISALGVAAWLRLHDGHGSLGLGVADHRATQVREALAEPDPARAVATACSVARLLPDDVDLSGFLGEVVRWFAMLRRGLVREAVREACDG